jgi:hypothetical protein
MGDPRDGGCQCGAVRYRIEGSPLALAVCHCRECQRQSGSAFGMSLAVPSAAFRLLSGALKTFRVTCDSGRVKTCAFCPECGTRIHHQVLAAVLSLKPGTLDDTAWLEPAEHFWTKRKQPWVAIPDEARCFADDG